jgi:hypothetical protein
MLDLREQKNGKSEQLRSYDRLCPTDAPINITYEDSLWSQMALLHKQEGGNAGNLSL